VSVALAVLADRLQRAVPQRDGAPADYERLAGDAMQQLGADLPAIATATIQVVAGTAAYALPTDFLYAISLEGGAPVQGGVLVSDAGLVPLPPEWGESWVVEGDMIRFDPAPGYSTVRKLRYAAGHVLVNGAYPRLSENGARIALLYAQHLALGEQANALAGDGWSYKIGDESVDKRGVSAAIQAQAAAMLANYHNALRPLRGYGSQYRQNPYAVGVEV
jgi:hypothetical protein